MTVEAALLFPIILGVILLVICLLFFQYDRCLMEQNTGVLAMRGCTFQMSDKKALVSELLSVSRQRDECYLAWEMKEADICFKGNEISVCRKGYLKFPISGIWDGQTGMQGKWEAQYRNYRICPVHFIRNYRKITGGN